ncbi:diiron oxygenase [Amycolatopsis sp. NPDC059021]|uniref:diiron oxygenase n=1 Tax=Amycolatopsis sp. NPDC059021 TaxID=3346704 RepID=UPI0036701B5C
MTSLLSSSDRLVTILDRLVGMSKSDYYNPYEVFDWPESLPEKQYWMSPELMSTYGTEVAGELSEEQLWAISKWESINFYSLNVHGIRELIVEIIQRIHTDEFRISSEYFHHMIGEENEHMWFFATFCLKYGDKIYPNTSFRLDIESAGPSAHFLVFARLLLFEEIVDYFNSRMGTDDRLHETIKQVNYIHHQDESRHVAFGRQIVSVLHADLRTRLSAAELAELETYVKRYLKRSVESLVSPAVFKDAGIPDPYALRRRILADPANAEYQAKILKRSMKFLLNEGILSDDVLPGPA